MTENETPQSEPTAREDDATQVGPEAGADQPEAPKPEGEAESVKTPYRVSKTEDKEGSVKRYTVEIETETFDEKIESIFRDLKKTVLIDGFRPGKAPIQLLKLRFGKEAQEDALKDLAENVGKQIVETDALQVVSGPELADSTVEAGKPVQLEIDIETMPKIDVAGYTGNEIEVEVEPVTDEAVERQIEFIRNANATYEAPKKARPFAAGDGATLDIVVTDAAGKRMAALCREDVFMRDPQEALPAEVAQALVGKKAGESLTQTVERTVKTRTGEEVVHKDAYQVSLKEIKERKVPEIDDEFAKDVGDFATLADLRARIREDLARQAEERKRERIMDKIFDLLIETNPFDAPKTVVAAQEYQTIVRDTERMRQWGIDLAAMGMSAEGYLSSAKSNAARFVKINLLINAIAQKENIEVVEADVEKEIERRAQIEGRKPLAIRAKLEAEKKLDSMRRSLIVDKVETFLVDRNNIKEVAPKKDEPAEKKASETSAKKIK